MLEVALETKRHLDGLWPATKTPELRKLRQVI